MVLPSSTKRHPYQSRETNSGKHLSSWRVSPETQHSDTVFLVGQKLPIMPCPSHTAHAMLYVGADLDVYSLHFLRRDETCVVFVDPLVFWRNTKNVSDYILSNSSWDASNFHDMFECEGCTRPLRSKDVRDVGYRLATGLRHHTCTSGLGSVNLHNHTGLANVRVAAVRWNRMPLGFEIDFMSDGAYRTLIFVAESAEAVDYSRALGGHPVSTFAWVGSSPIRAQAGLTSLCTQGLVVTHSLRVIASSASGFITINPSLPEYGGSCKGMRPYSHGHTWLGCGCTYAYRFSRPCYVSSRFSTKW